jgi:hypothetical protein
VKSEPCCRSERGWGALAGPKPAIELQWLRGSSHTVFIPGVPSDFDWRAYLKWNPELEMQGIHTQEAAEDHYVTIGHSRSLVYRDFELTIRYTACGGLINQHYCHLATIALAKMSKASKIIWPPMQVCTLGVLLLQWCFWEDGCYMTAWMPMQERKSFHIRYHPDASQNEQKWEYLDATTVWDMPRIRKDIKRAIR